jgi:hypothetical protein
VAWKGTAGIGEATAIATEVFFVRLIHPEATKIKGASAVKPLRPLKLNRKVFTLPGSIWREDNPVVHRRQSNSHCIAVKNL